MMFCTLIVRHQDGSIIDTIEIPEGEKLTARHLRAVLISRAHLGARTVEKILSEERRPS